MESTAAATKMNRRRGPLHTCGVSIFAIACLAYKKALEFNGTIGSLTKRMNKLATPTFPFVHAIQYHLLAFLSFADDHILVAERIIEDLFPPSTRLFDKIDEFVQAAETLPGKFDDAMSKFPTVVHQVSFFDWVLICLISWLKFLISTLTHLGSNNTKEKEIMVDLNYNNLNTEPESAEEAELILESPSHFQSENDDKSSICASLQDETKIGCHEHCSIDCTTDSECQNVERSDSSENANKGVMKCSYKEMLEKGNNESQEDGLGVVKCSYKEMLEKGNADKVEGEFKVDSPKAINSGGESVGKDDPILELFEASWHMKTRKRR